MNCPRHEFDIKRGTARCAVGRKRGINCVTRSPRSRLVVDPALLKPMKRLLREGKAPRVHFVRRAA